MISNDTQYGKRSECPYPGCSVVLWDGSTSTPADLETRQARKRAHALLDPLWKSSSNKGKSRSFLYKDLSKRMNLPAEETHVGMFNVEQCEEVCSFCKEVREAMGDGADYDLDRMYDHDEVKEVITFSFEKLIRETELAWRLLLDSSDFLNPQKEWFPKSRCSLDEDDNTIAVPEWLAIEKDLL
jgi:hypothetical protein